MTRDDFNKFVESINAGDSKPKSVSTTALDNYFKKASSLFKSAKDYSNPEDYYNQTIGLNKDRFNAFVELVNNRDKIGEDNYKKINEQLSSYSNVSDGIINSYANQQTVQRPNSDLHRTNAEKQSKSGDKVSAVGDSAYAGLTGINANIMGAVKAVDDFVWGDLFQRSDYRPLKPIYDYYLKENERAQAEKQSEIENGNLNPYVDALVSGTVQAVPTAVLGAMSGGTSLAGQAATTGANLSTAQLAANTAKEIAKNPNFIYSAVQTFGGTYEDAKQNGADTNTAIRAALLNAIPQSLIEVSGGTEKLVAKLANKTKGLAGDVFKSALEEGLEEVLQYPVEGIVKKTTYAPETPIFSTKESAVINPKEMAENFAVGASVGGILGGASAGTAKVFNTVVENNVKKQQALQQEQLENRAAIAQAMKMGIVQDISGKYNYSRIGSDGTVRIYSNVFQNVEPEKQRSFIKQYAQDNYITHFDNAGKIIGEDKGITIKSDGSRVYITGQGINDVTKKVRGGNNIPFMESILELPSIIENSNLVDKGKADEKGRPFLWDSYESKIYINQIPYTVSLKIKNPPTGGNRYYYHTIDEIKIEPNPSHGTLAVENQPLPYLIRDENGSMESEPSHGTLAVEDQPLPNLFSDYPDSNKSRFRHPIGTESRTGLYAQGDRTEALSNPTIPQEQSGVKNSIRENAENMTENRQIRVPESELKVMKAIAKNHKIPFEIKDLGVDAKGSPIEGKYENGVIYVSPYAKNPSLVIFKHELTHYLENDTYRYGQLLNVVKSYYDKMGETLGTDYAAEIRKIYDNYRARGKTLEDGEAERELVANFAGKYLFTDEKAIQYLAKKRPNIARSIVNWIREQIAAIKGDAESELLIRAERMYVNALKAADKRAGIEGKAKYSTQYSLGYTTDNKPVVVVEDDILKGVPKNKWIETVKNTISEKFSDGIPVSGRLIKVNSVTRNEYANSRNTRYLRATDGSVYADKFKSANNLDEIVLASTNYINEDLKHQRNDSFKEFARGDVLIRVGDNDYSAKVIVGFTGGKEMVLYDIINFTPTEFSIKKERTHQGYAQAGSPRKDVSSGNTTVPQKAQSVNTSISKNAENDTKNSQFYLSDDYDNAVEQYGAIPPGENPARDVKVPKQMNDNTKVRRTVRTAMEASGTPGELVDRLKVDIANDVYDYKVVSDKSAVSSAKDRLDKWGLEKCYQYWKSLVNEDRKISKNDLALAEQMYIESAHNGDFKVSQELMVDIAEEATRAGQNAQSIRLLKNLTPEGRIYKIDKLVYRIQKEIDRKTNGKAKTIKVDENLKKRMLNAKSQEEMDAIEHMVHKNIAKQMPEPTKMEKAVRKWNEWRYLAMLGNPRTHIRNIFGNALFAPMVNGKNAIGIALERTLSKDNRTKARLTAKDKATIEFAKSDFDTVNAEESKSSKNKYNESLNGLDVEEKVFKNKALEWARKTNSNLLEWEDTKAKRKRYSKSFAQFIKARGWDYQNLTDSQLDSARNYAMREAKRATFQDTSEVANALNKLSHQNIATEVLVEGLLPFKKTPINILKRGVEYSPFGIAKGIKELAWDVKKGNMNASQAIDTLSCGLSGTAMMMVGVLLSSLGVLTSTSDDDKEGEFDKLSGNQEYALQFFGKSYTIDWIAPLSMPLFIGAEIENAVERGDADNGAGIGRVLDALTGISDPMFNLSMLQGINSSIKTVRYSDNPTVDLAANTVSGYLGQGIPTILGQTARTVDTTRRNSYYTPKDSAAGKLIDKTIKKTAAKIPGVSMLLEPYIDKWGNEQVADNWVLNAFENFASPGYYSENTNDSVTEEMARLYKATSDTGVVPHSAKSSLSTGGNTYRLSEKEYTQYQKTLGKASHEQLQKLINSTAYSNMSNEEKAVAVGKMYRYAEESAKVEFYKGRGIDFDDTPTIKKFNEVEESGVDLYDYLYAYVSVKDMESDKNASGETIRGSLKRKQISCMVNQLGIPAKTANKIYDLMH